MSVELVTLSVQVPKELNEALTALEGIVLDVKAGKSLAEIAAGRFQELTRAAEGLGKVASEVSEAPVGAVLAGVVHGVNVVKALLGK